MTPTAPNHNGGAPKRRPAWTTVSGSLSRKVPFTAFEVPRRDGRPPLWLAAIGVIVVSAALMTGCSNVKPWERETLSQAGMQLDPEPLITACDDHVYFSREASKGGRSYSGGGCGCD